MAPDKGKLRFTARMSPLCRIVSNCKAESACMWMLFATCPRVQRKPSRLCPVCRLTLAPGCVCLSLSGLAVPRHGRSLRHLIHGHGYVSSSYHGSTCSYRQVGIGCYACTCSIILQGKLTMACLGLRFAATFST